MKDEVPPGFVRAGDAARLFVAGGPEFWDLVLGEMVGDWDRITSDGLVTQGMACGSDVDLVFVKARGRGMGVAWRLGDGRPGDAYDVFVNGGS